jgi:hypothetical protein
MSSVNKLLSKINQATTAIKSVKGISSKIFGTGYQSDVSKFEQDSLEYQTNLATRAKALKESSSNSTALSRQESKRTPQTFENKELIYPVDYTVENYVHFTINPRKKRRGTGDNNTTHIYLYAPNIQDNAPSVSYKNLEFGNVARGLMDAEAKFSQALGAEFDEQMAKAVNRLFLNTRDFSKDRVFNPQLETMFDGMTFRTFDMQFQFRPNSQLEADKVREIIFELKKSMLPDTFLLDSAEKEVDPSTTTNSADEFTQNYFNIPNIFSIEYVGPIADKVDGFLPAFLTACNVTYNGGGKMETFVDGTPLIIDMTLSFQENAIMSKQIYESSVSSFAKSSSVEGESAEGGESVDGEVPVVTLPSALPSGNRGGFSGNIPFGGG